MNDSVLQQPILTWYYLWRDAAWKFLKQFKYNSSVVLQPLKCKGWERALLDFTLAMITDSASEGKPPLKKRLKDISCPGNAFWSFFLLICFMERIDDKLCWLFCLSPFRHKCWFILTITLQSQKVLVVTGDTDRLVPAWNAERLAKAIPGSKFEVIKNCGHLPQEEKPEEFLAIVQKFLQWVVSTSNQPILQAAI